MAIIEALKVLGEVVVEAAKENPVVTACIGGTVLVGVGATIYCKKRKAKESAKKLSEITVSEEALAAAAVAHAKVAADAQAVPAN